MPNWCSNALILKTSEEDFKNHLMIMKLQESEDFTFQYYVPSSKGDDWYDSNVANWGTKWNPRDVDMYFSPNEVHITFETAWSPPKLELFKAICKKHNVEYASLTFEEEAESFRGEYLYEDGEFFEDYEEGPFDDEDDEYNDDDE